MNRDSEQKEWGNVSETLRDIKHEIVVMSGKGGVGKSTVSVNLACELALRGFRVGLLDADITGPDIAKLLHLEDKKPEVAGGKILPIAYPVGSGVAVMSMAFLTDENTAIIWRGPMKHSVINQFLSNVEWGALDYLIVDLPPGTSDEPLSLAKFISFTGFALIVTTPQELALLDVKKSINFAKRLNLNILGIIENMSGFTCPHCGGHVDLFKKGGGEKIAQTLQLPFLGRLEFNPRIVEGGDEGKPFVLEENLINKTFTEIVGNIEKIVKEKAF